MECLQKNCVKNVAMKQKTENTVRLSVRIKEEKKNGSRNSKPEKSLIHTQMDKFENGC